MVEPERWLELASLGLGVLALVLGVSFVLEKALEQLRRRPTSAADLFDIGSAPAQVGLWPATASKEEEVGIGADEILTTSPGPVVEWVLGAGERLMVRTRRATDGHTLTQIVATAGALLLLACLGVTLFLPLLLVAALGYLADSNHDLRLRSIVGIFLVDLALQVIANI